MIKVMVVDDHDLVRAGIVKILAEPDDIQVVAEAGDGAEAIEFCKSNPVDVILLDLNMPNLNGIDTAKKILRVQEGAKIIVLTAQVESPLSQHLLGVGVLGYVTKSARPKEIIKAIRTVHKNEKFLCENMSKKMAMAMISGASSHVDSLSPRELEVLIKIAEGHTNAEIINQLNVSPKTISTHRSRIMNKLNAKSDVELAKMAMEYGLVDKGLSQ